MKGAGGARGAWAAAARAAGTRVQGRVMGGGGGPLGTGVRLPACSTPPGVQQNAARRRPAQRTQRVKRRAGAGAGAAAVSPVVAVAAGGAAHTK